MTDGVTFFYGAASGGARKALKRMEEPNVMISFATKNNTPWDGIQTLFVDCGAYSMMKGGEKHGPLDEYLEYLQEHQPDYFALRDYPCEPDLLVEWGRTVNDHISMTVESHLEMLDALWEGPYWTTGQPFSVIQGWQYNDYLRCIELFETNGIPLDYVAVGSVCRRHRAAEVARILRGIRSQLPDAHIHAFGVKTSVLSQPGVLESIDSADSLAYSYASMVNDGRGDWRSQVYEYLRVKRRIDSIQPDPHQEVLPHVEG